MSGNFRERKLPVWVTKCVCVCVCVRERESVLKNKEKIRQKKFRRIAAGHLLDTFVKKWANIFRCEIKMGKQTVKRR